MEKYIRLSQKSLLALTSMLSARRISGLPSGRVPHSEGLEGMLRDMISVPSVTGDYDQLHRLLDYTDEFLSERGLRVKRFEWDSVESLVATTQRTKTPKVMLMAHLDVVPAPDQLYTLRVKNGKYMGRGVFDMKFAAAAYLQLIDDIQDNLAAYDIGIMLVTDEELGGFNGAQKLVEEGYLPDVIVIPDGGDNWHLETFCKGVWHITITATGKDAHGSRPWEGESATGKLMDILHAIQTAFPYKDQTSSTINIGVFNGGDVVNKVASEASAGLDIRIASVEDDRKLHKTITAICKKYGAAISSEIYSAPVVNDPKHPLLQSFMQSIKRVTGQTSGETISFAATDGRFFAEAGVPCVIVRPPGGNLHGPNEWISQKGLFDLKDVLRDYVEREAKQN